MSSSRDRAEVRPFRAALVQMAIERGRPDVNLARAADLIGAAATDAELVLLPEVLDLGWTHHSAAHASSSVPDGRSVTALADAARLAGVYVCAGVAESDGSARFNSAVLIDPTGRVLLHHRKVNELANGRLVYQTGDRLGVCRTDLGCLGLLICADGLVDGGVLTRALGYMGADVVLVPSSWVRPMPVVDSAEEFRSLWIHAFVPVAEEFSMWILATSNVGYVTDALVGLGSSLAVSPQGEIRAVGSYGPTAEEIVYVDVIPTPRPAAGTEWLTHLAHVRERWR